MSELPDKCTPHRDSPLCYFMNMVAARDRDDVGFSFINFLKAGGSDEDHDYTKPGIMFKFGPEIIDNVLVKFCPFCGGDLNPDHTEWSPL